jgi:hypothetical protein
MVEPFDTNRDPGDETNNDNFIAQWVDEILQTNYPQLPEHGKNYYLVKDENGCLSISAKEEINRKYDVSPD